MQKDSLKDTQTRTKRITIPAFAVDNCKLLTETYHLQYVPVDAAAAEQLVMLVVHRFRQLSNDIRRVTRNEGE